VAGQRAEQVGLGDRSGRVERTGDAGARAAAVVRRSVRQADRGRDAGVVAAVAAAVVFGVGGVVVAGAVLALVMVLRPGLGGKTGAEQDSLVPPALAHAP